MPGPRTNRPKPPSRFERHVSDALRRIERREDFMLHALQTLLKGVEADPVLNAKLAELTAQLEASSEGLEESVDTNT